MSSSAQSRLIDSIRKIAKTDPEIRTALKALRSRGVLDAIEVAVGVGETLGPESCCEEGDPDEDDTRDPDGDPDINNERPDDGENEKGMDGQYRMPDGTLEPWNDAQCTPDDTWEPNTYWQYYAPGYNCRNPSVSGLLDCMPDRIYKISSFRYRYDWKMLDNDRVAVYYGSPGISWSQVGSRAQGCTQQDYIDGVCTTSAPCIEDDSDWPSDGKCQEALINGQFVPHPKDPDCSSKTPRDFQTMCQGEGAEQECVTYIPTADGGHMRVTVDPVTRLPDSNSTTSYYDSSGKFKREESYRLRNVQGDAYSPDNVPGNWE